MLPFCTAADASPHSTGTTSTTTTATAVAWLSETLSHSGPIADTLALCIIPIIGFYSWTDSVIISQSQSPCTGPRSHAVKFLILHPHPPHPCSPYVIMVCPHYEWLVVTVFTYYHCYSTSIEVMETTSLKTEIDHNRYAVTGSSFQAPHQLQQNTNRLAYPSYLQRSWNFLLYYIILS